MGEPINRASSVQTDLFCTCGYNLYMQVVHVDERLGIPICRCPECGRYHAMNTTLPAQSPWTARVGVLLMAGYVLFMLYGVVMTTFGIGAIQYGFVAVVEESTRVLTREWYSQASLAEQLWWRWLPGIMFAVCMIAGFLYMMLAATFFWHWRRDSYWNLLVVGPLTAGIVCWIGLENQDRAFMGNTTIWRLTGGLVAVMLGMGLGVFWGRKVVRGLLTCVLVPRARQSLAFLWLVDGKPAPGLGAAARQQPCSPVE
ncbi:MAG: hypothetical protein ABSH20_13710 [Tepidisphaeraceae bacterium]|jgi:hypothetical protein